MRRHKRRRPRQKSPGLSAMREPSRVGSCPFSFPGTLAEHVREKYARVNAMRGVVWARVDAAWLFQVRAEIAGSCFLLDDGFFAAGALGVLDHHFERMQINVAVRTILRAKAAADAPI